MNKKLLAVGVAAALSITAVSAMAVGSVTLTGRSLPGQIYVACTSGGTTYPAYFPIPANGKLGPLPDTLVRGMFKAKGVTPMPCTFTLNSLTGPQVGTANLAIAANNNAMQVSNVTYVTGYKVIAPVGPQTNLKITLSH